MRLSPALLWDWNAHTGHRPWRYAALPNRINWAILKPQSIYIFNKPREDWGKSAPRLLLGVSYDGKYQFWTGWGRSTLEAWKALQLYRNPFHGWPAHVQSRVGQHRSCKGNLQLTLWKQSKREMHKQGARSITKAKLLKTRGKQILQGGHEQCQKTQGGRTGPKAATAEQESSTALTSLMLWWATLRSTLWDGRLVVAFRIASLSGAFCSGFR